MNELVNVKAEKINNEIESLNQNENRNVSEVIDEFTEMLANQSGLMFDGEPITDDDRRKIIDAIRVAAAVAVNSRNRNGG